MTCLAPLARVALTAVLAGAVMGCTSQQPAVAPSASVLTLSPAPSGQPAPARLSPPPAPGSVTVRSGPFDDRFDLTAPSLRDGAVSTELTITSDVSEVLVIEATADFYDAAGVLLGSARTEHVPDHGADHAEGVPDERVALRLPADPAWAARASSAVFSVPVLVNE